MTLKADKRDPLALMRRISQRRCDVGQLFDLDAPDETPLCDAPLPVLAETLDLCQTAMLRVFEDIGSGALALDSVVLNEATGKHVPLWSGALCVAACYYDHAVSRILSAAPLDASVELVHEPHIPCLLDVAEAADSKPVAGAAFFMARYLQAYCALHAFRTCPSAPLLGIPFVSLLEFVHSPIRDLTRFILTEHAFPLGAFALLSTRSALANVTAVCKALSEESLRVLKKTVLSSKGVALAELACRSEDAVEHFGQKNVDAIFERQLDFAMQSFGFLVSHARRGARGADLVCICNQVEPYTLLLEAKSSRRPYHLPTKDARALREYVLQTQVTLATLPPLRLVLIVGPKPASTLAAKLEALEADAHMPMRYCEASVLADLRRRLPGPVPAQSFLRTLQRSDHIIGPGFVDAVAGTYECQQQCHDRFIQEGLSEGMC